jgi:hypothetical protein
MARTQQGALLTERHRARQLAVRAEVIRELLSLWQLVDPTNLSATIGPFARASVALIDAGYRRSVDLALAYIQGFRAIEAQPARGGSMLMLATAFATPTPDLTTNAIRGAGLAGIVRARRRGQSVDAAARHGFVKVSGSASNLVLAGGRNVIDEAIQSDRRALGWMRVTDGSPCWWCAMLASRGPVYKSEGVESAGFDMRSGLMHDHDGCTIEPVYTETARTDQAQWPTPSRLFRVLWDSSTVGLLSNDARLAFRRAFEGRPAPGDPILQGQPAPPVTGTAA